MRTHTAATAPVTCECMPKFAGTRQKLRVCVPTAIENDATRDGARIDLNQTSLRSGLPSVPCPVYVRRRPALPVVAIASYQADSSIQITKPHRVTNQNSESQMNTSSRFIVGARFGEVPTLVRVQRCGLGRPPVDLRPSHSTTALALLVVMRSTTPRRAVGELHPVPSLDHLQSLSGKNTAIVMQ